MQSTIIELSQYTSSNVIQNGEWTNNLCKPVTVNDGDYIMVKQGMIDTALISQSSILIENDVQWTLKFCYYIIDHGISQVYNNDNNEQKTPSGLPFVLIENTTKNPQTNEQIATPIIDSITVSIPAGTYDRQYLATYITRQFQSLGYKNNLAGGGLQPNIYFTNGSIYPQYDANGNCTGFTAPQNPPDQRFVATPFQRPLFTQVIEPVQPPPQGFINNMLYMDSGNYPQLNPCYYAMLCNNTPLPYTFNNNGFVSKGTKLIDDKNYNGVVIGSSQVALLYNDENNGLYSFQYLHNPLTTSTQTNGSLSEVTGFYIIQPDLPSAWQLDNIRYFNSFSGILIVDTFTNLSADKLNDPFFNQLGLNYNDLVPNNILNIFKKPTEGIINENYNFNLDYNEFLRTTTRNYTPMSTILSTNTIKTSGSISYQVNAYEFLYPIILTTNNPPFNESGYNFTDSPSTNSLIFSNVSTSNNISAGHFLIEVQGYANEYINEEEQLSIKGIIASFYLSPDSFCVSMGPDSLIYQHRGLPMTLNNLKIRILNPITKDVDPNLGARSTIYLSVTKEKPLPTITDKSKEDNKK